MKISQKVFELLPGHKIMTDDRQTDRQMDRQKDRRTDKVIAIGLRPVRWRGPKKIDRGRGEGEHGGLRNVIW